MGHDEEVPRESGIPRRTLIKRGAIVGGLVWATPVVQSLRTPAHAQEAPGSPLCTACLQTIVDLNGNNPPPPETRHTQYLVTTTCCDCLDANGGDLVTCAILGACVPDGPPLQTGPCPRNSQSRRTQSMSTTSTDPVQLEEYLRGLGLIPEGYSGEVVVTTVTSEGSD